MTVEIVQKLKVLEHKLNQLEQSLQRGSHPWGMINARRVIGSLEDTKVIKTNISQYEIVNVYRDVPQILASIAIRVSLTPDSYRQKTSGEVYLENINSGNYWIIATLENNYWLVPKSNIVINTPGMKVVQLLFNCQGYQASKTQEFVLQKPAKVVLSDDNKHWKLEALGELSFQENVKTSPLQTALKQIQEEKLKIQKLTQSLEDKSSQEIRQQINQISQELKQIQENIRNNQQINLEQIQRQIVAVTEENRVLKLLLEEAARERKEMRSQLDDLMRSQTANPPSTKKKIVDKFNNWNDSKSKSYQSTTEENNVIKVNWQNATVLYTLTGHTDSVRTVAISNWKNQQPIIATGSFDRTIKLWNLDTGTLINTLEETSHINAIAINPSQPLLVSGCDDHKLQIWNLETLTSIRLEVHSNRVLALAMSQDGQILVSGSRDHTLKIWNWTLSALELKHDITEDYGTILDVAITPDNQQLVAVYGDNTVRLWDIKTGKLVSVLIQYIDLIWAIAITPDSKTLVCGCRDRTIQVINLPTGELKRTLTAHTQAVWTVAISPDGQTLASGSSDNTIIVWDLNTGEWINILTGHSGDILAVSFSPNGDKLISCSRDRTVKIWQPSIF